LEAVMIHNCRLGNARIATWIDWWDEMGRLAVKQERRINLRDVGLFAVRAFSDRCYGLEGVSP
jgi:hypothetical protein